MCVFFYLCCIVLLSNVSFLLPLFPLVRNGGEDKEMGGEAI